jgi:hypothetical protein
MVLVFAIPELVQAAAGAIARWPVWQSEAATIAIARRGKPSKQRDERPPAAERRGPLHLRGLDDPDPKFRNQESCVRHSANQESHSISVAPGCAKCYTLLLKPGGAYG